jgi:hypothetical protein
MRLSLTLFIKKGAEQGFTGFTRLSPNKLDGDQQFI